MKAVFTLITLRTAICGVACNMLMFISQNVSAKNEISPQSDLSARLTITNVSICGNGYDGSIIAIPNGGTAPYNFLWTGPNGFSSSNEAIYNLRYGYYNLTLTDANGQVYNVSNIHVAKAFFPVISHSGSNTGTCNNTGTLIIYAAAGVNPYTYSIDGIHFQESNLFTGLAAGNYTLYAKDAKGCIGNNTAILNAAPPITITPFIYNATSCHDDGKIALYATGGIPPYAYSLDGINYQLSNSFPNLPPAGGYFGFIKDSKGCVIKSQRLSITRLPSLMVTTSQSNSSSCINNGTITIKGTGGNRPYNYSIDGVQYFPTNVFTSLAPGTYTCYIKDIKNCIGTTTTIVNSTPTSGYATILPGNSCNTNGTFILHPTTGTGPYSYSNDNINFRVTNIFTGLSGGIYTGWIKDSKGCVAEISNINIPSGTQLEVSATKVNTSSCISNGTISVSASGGNQPYTFRLNNGTYGSNPVFGHLSQGNYMVYTKDANGCEGFTNSTINVVPIYAAATTTNVTNCSISNGTITINQTGGRGNITYSIDGNNYQTSNVFTGLEEGVYDAFVKDQNVCIGIAPNVEVHSDCSSFSGKIKIDVEINKPAAEISISPNPSSAEFNLHLNSATSLPVSIYVYDAAGRVLWKSSGEAPGYFRFGAALLPGIYRVNVVSKYDRKTLTVIKQ